MKLFLPVLVLLFALPGFSQLEATTKEGKKVVLYKNGTWKYAKTSAKTTVSPSVAVPVVTEAQPPAGDLKNEAREFSLQLISTFFSEDCDAYYSFLSSEILTMKPDGIFPVTDEFKNKVCQSVKSAVDDNSKTLQEYLATYKIEMLTRAEIEAKAGRALPEHFNTLETEFYFVGFELKEGTATTNFIWGDMFVFLVRKTNAVWKMKGLLGG